MPKWLPIVTESLKAVLIFSLIVVLWLGVIGVQRYLPEVISFLRDAHSAVNTTSDNINRPCETDKPCGTIADVNRTLGTVRGTFGQIEIATNSFNRNQGIFFGQEAQLYAHSDTVLTQFSGLLGSTKGVINGFTPLQNRFLDVENQAYDEFGELKTTTNTVNSFLVSDDFKGTAHNLNGISGNLDQWTGDITKKTHDLLYPPPCKGKLCGFKRAYEITKDIAPLTEPTYFAIEAIKALENK